MTIQNLLIALITLLVWVSATQWYLAGKVAATENEIRQLERLLETNE